MQISFISIFRIQLFLRINGIARALYFDPGTPTRLVAASALAMEADGDEVDRMEDGDESSDDDASDTELLQQITELEAAVSST